MPVFTPNLTTLPPPQRQLWPELAATPEGFALYRGTTLALHYFRMCWHCLAKYKRPSLRQRLVSMSPRFPH